VFGDGSRARAQDDPDLGLPNAITIAGLGRCLANAYTTHQEYKQYEYGNAQGLQLF
jgi:hypothetical protein